MKKQIDPNTDKSKIVQVYPDSLAQEMGVEPGDYLLALDNQTVEDILDYYFLISDDYVEILLEKSWGEQWLIEVEKDFDELLGVEFEKPTINSMRSCKNNCIFCFVNQLPQGMRNSLYVKDDDYRVSPFHGNYITLTNLDENDLVKMMDYRISPMYISVHTTNPDLRVKMLKNHEAAKINHYLHKFKSAGIEMHGQIVLCPGVNDGRELENSIKDLSELFPEFQSLAVVPVGLTKHRNDDELLSPVTPDTAKHVIELIEFYQADFLKQIGTRFVFPSDELYILANKKFPDFESYEQFPQIDNGVGLSVKFESEACEAISCYWQKLEKCNEIAGTIVTGKLGAVVLNKVLNALSHRGISTSLTIYTIDNYFFGEQVTVTGLITGQDIIDQLQPQLKEQIFTGPVLIPEVMLRDGENAFLDDITVQDLAKTLNVEIVVVPTSGVDFIKTLITISK